MESNTQPEEKQTGPDATGFVIAPMAAAAALDTAAFSKVKVKYAQGELTEARQYPEESVGGADSIPLPVDQVIHLKWYAPAFSPRGNSLVLPAFQSIELLRDYRRAEQAIAKRWATAFRLLKVEDKVKEVKEDIVVALGLSRSLVTGDGPNFATASVSLHTVIYEQGGEADVVE